MNNHMRIALMEQDRKIKTIWTNSKKWGIHINNIKRKYGIEDIENKNIA